MLFVVVTFDRFQPAKLELNAAAKENMVLVFVQRLVFQLFSGRLKAVALWNMPAAAHAIAVGNVQSLMG